MPDVTNRLGLKKPLGNENFTRAAYNENLDIIDVAAETPSGAQGKVDLAVQGLNVKIDAELAAKMAKALSLIPGVQIVNSDRKSRAKVTKMTGRTLVNLLGRAGNCESVGKFAKANVTEASDTANYTTGTQSLKYTASGSNVEHFAAAPQALLIADAYYVVVGMVQPHVGKAMLRTMPMDTASNGLFNADSQIIMDTTKFSVAYVKFKAPTGAVKLETRMHLLDAANGIVFTAGSTAENASFDAIRVYQITQAEYDALATMTADQVAAKYPYVDDIKSVNAVYVQNPGKNLFPPSADWRTKSANSVITGESNGTITGIGGAVEYFNYDMVPIAGETYTFSVKDKSPELKLTVEFYTDNTFASMAGETISTFNNAVTFLVPSGCGIIRLWVSNESATVGTWQNGTFFVTGVMLNVGSVALPFEPQKPSYMYLPDVQLRSNVDGSVADTLFIRDGQPRAIRRFREMVLDGSLAWTFNVDGAGYKVATITIANGINYTGAGVKYDGKILQPAVTLTAADQQSIYNNAAYVTIADVDSGWGETYTPTAAEIQAYFYGWVMSNNFTGKYDGTGTKAWEKRWSGQGNQRDTGFGSIVVNGSGTTTLPVTMNDQGYTPYRLTYQLAQSYEDAVSYEGDLFLHDGANQIEVGTGVVVREAAKLYDGEPGGYGPNYYTNHATIGGGSKWRYRPLKAFSFYRNGIKDASFDPPPSIVDPYFRIAKSRYDQSAAYAVTYLALDTYALGIAPASISAEYAPNVKEALDDIALAVAHTRTQVSALQTTKAQKQQPQWIAPTLLNGWVVYDASTVCEYYKDETATVHLRGRMKSGTTGTKVFKLPVGYRAAAARLYLFTVRGGGDTTAYIQVTSDGDVTMLNGATSDVSLDGIAFRAEQ